MRILLIAALLLPVACDETAPDEPVVEADRSESAEEDLVAAPEDDEDEATRKVEIGDSQCDYDPAAVDPAENNEFFVARSRRELEFHDGVDFTIDPDDNTVHAQPGGGGGVSMTCKCGDFCQGGNAPCFVGSEGPIATCGGGACEMPGGYHCGICLWHHTIPKPGFPTPLPPAPPLPQAP